MSNVKLGSARVDENGKYSGGAAGDQKQTKVDDYSGEVSMQDFYIHPKGWNVIRANSVEHAIGIASAMVIACNNVNIGYNQAKRLDIIKYGVWSKVKTSCDCSSLVRECVKAATGVDPGNFTTANEVSMLMATNLFVSMSYTPGMTLYTGDILVTATKGHTVVVVSGEPRDVDVSEKYYKKYAGNTTSIVSALSAVGETDTSFNHRLRIAKKNKIEKYTGTAKQNTEMLNLLKLGKLKKA